MTLTALPAVPTRVRHHVPVGPARVRDVPPRGRPAGTVHGYLRDDGPGVRTALVRAGSAVIHVEAVGGGCDRPVLATLLGALRRGDTVVVASLDQLAPTVARVVRLVSTLAASGVVLRTLQEGIDTATPAGREVAAACTALAAYDRRLARPAPTAREGRPGRPRSLTAAQVERARADRDAGTPVGRIAAGLGVGRSTLYRALADPA